MPQKMLRPCYKQGCPNLTRTKYCEQHAHLEADEKADANHRYNHYNRDPTTQNFYHSSAWVTLRTQKILATPFCELCYKEGKLTHAKVVDHIIEIKDDWNKRLDIDNLQSLCTFHHNQKTAEARNNRNNKN